ncbi:MAG: histidine--tRNA ligase [Bacteroidetes bacterium]|nr:histidine--tRNA ligase [Bacteroidota bacterium]
MSKQKPSIPKGTRDFGPEAVSKRNYIIDIIKSVYQLYGYQPLETPVMENLSTLMGKYGEEGDKLLFKIINSGDYLKDVDSGYLQERNSNKMLTQISEKGLRYDLTVPFARYVVMNQNELAFPFKRYQIQPVWRADKPQKGRYREFYQCDADVIGSNSLMLDAEMVMMIADVFDKLNLSVTIRLNNRKILDGLNEYIGETEKNVALVTAIDKLDKVGLDGVEAELKEKEFTSDQINKIKTLLSYSGDTSGKIEFLENIFTGEKGTKGISEIKSLFEKLKGVASEKIQIQFDLTLARGLSYYTGTIYEVVSNEVKIGSILGGGRYDDLTGIFGLPNMSGVGISFGLDRIYDVITELNRFPAAALSNTQVLFIPFDTDAEQFAIACARQLRTENIRCEVYPDLNAKMGKKFKYADDKKIPYTAVIGSNEMAEEKVALKNMSTGEQKLVTLQELISELNGESGFAFLDLSE